MRDRALARRQLAGKLLPGRNEVLRCGWHG
jgi:hypothetical protein